MTVGRRKFVRMLSVIGDPMRRACCAHHARMHGRDGAGRLARVALWTAIRSPTAEIAARLARLRAELRRSASTPAVLAAARERLLPDRPRSLGLLRAAPADRAGRRRPCAGHARHGAGDHRAQRHGWRSSHGHSDSETAADAAARVHRRARSRRPRIGLEAWTSGLSHGLAGAPAGGGRRRLARRLAASSTRFGWSRARPSRR